MMDSQLGNEKLSQHLLEFLEGVADCVAFFDRDWNCTFLNAHAIAELRGRDLLGKNIWKAFPAVANTSFWDFYHRAMDERTKETFETYFAPFDTWYEVHAIPIREGLAICFHNTNKHHAAAQSLTDSKRQLATLINNLPGLVYTCKPRSPWHFSFISEGAELLTGYSPSDFLESKLTWADIILADDLQNVDDAVNEGVVQHRPFSVMYRIINRQGQVRWVLDRGQCIYDSAGEPVVLEGFISDITAEKEAEERIRWVAHHDPLTQLPNRLLFQEHIEEAIRGAGASGKRVCLLLLDLDHFKEINDNFGHDTGDAVLKAMARRLSGIIRGIDDVARTGGDEFGIVLADVESDEDLWAVMKPILDHVQQPILSIDYSVECPASIGASLWPDHAQTADELLKQADTAMQVAKSSGHGKLVMFEPAMREDARLRSEMLRLARHALEDSRIEPFYQPKVSLATGQICGFEALLRWRASTQQLQAPAGLQAAFEDPRLAIALGQRMQSRVFADLKSWREAGLDIGRVAINAAAAEFRNDDFAEQVLARLAQAGLPTSCLEIEVTETVFLGRGAEYVERAVRRLSQAGVTIALDDFGTGYASLSHLKQFPVDSIKIDRSFVQDLVDHGQDAAILQAILQLGSGLGIATVAEGIETEAQATYLRAKGCDCGQGYLFAKALPADAALHLARNWVPDRDGRLPISRQGAEG